MDGAMTGPSGAPPGIMATVTVAGYRVALPGACMQPSDVLTLLTGLHASLVGRQGSGGGVATPRGRNLCVMGTKTATEWYDISQSDFIAVAAPRCAAGFVAAADSGNSAGSIAADSEARLQDEYSQKLQEVLVKIECCGTAGCAPMCGGAGKPRNQDGGGLKHGTADASEVGEAHRRLH